MQERPRYDEAAGDMEVIEDENNARRPFKAREHSPDHIPHTPSPLGLSNYDAIDLEGDPYDDEWDDEPQDHLANSDFNMREPIDAHVVDLDSYPSSHYDTDPVPNIESRSKDIMRLVANDEKQQEVSFAQF
jgi:hypothetical protein